MQRQVTRVLTRARTLISCHPPSSRGPGGLSVSPGEYISWGLFRCEGLQNDLRIIKAESHKPYFPRRFSSAPDWPNPPLRSLYKLRLTTIDHGRRSGLIVGLVLGTGYFSRKEGLADIAHCENDQRTKPSSNEAPEWNYQQSQFGRVVKKLWVPSLCVLTISLSWQHPVSLLVNLLFLMWSTKPNPSSIYMWVEQMRQQEDLTARGLDRMKAQAAGVMHVEVRDNILFCLARVTSLTKKSTLVGLLGDWWVVSSSSSAIHTGVKLRNLIPIVGPFTREQFS